MEALPTVVFCVFISIIDLHFAFDKAPRAVYQSNNSSYIPKMVGGRESSLYQFPFMVAILHDRRDTSSFLCSGAIISHTYLMTSAHCEESSNASYVAVAGIINLGIVTDDTQIRRVSRFISHPRFRRNITRSEYDIAILMVRTSFFWSKAVQPAFLPKPGEEFDGYAVLVAWSKTEFKFPAKLQYASKRLLSLHECHSLVSFNGSQYILYDTNVCTTGAEFISACSNDIGSPLIQNNIIVGIFSWGGAPCGIFRKPTIYTKVSSFTTWIRSLVKDLP